MKRSTILLDWPRGAFLLLFFLLTIGSGRPATAHPHAWIDLRSTVVLDSGGLVVAIDQEWLFDEFYTLFVLDGLEEQKGDKDKGLLELARVNLENLRPYGYFTDVRANDTKIELGSVTDFETGLRDDRLWLRFKIPLERPLDPRKDKIRFAIFDPTYYIEILHLKDDVIAFQGGNSGACSGRILLPNPSKEAVLLASALDRGAKPDETLGALFAETVVVECR
jgi:ABC-type uncharacterized transport system substrate-binding protein